MNIAIIERLPSGSIGLLITNMHDRHMLARCQELAAAPDPDAPLPVLLATGGIWQVDGDSILEVFEVPEGTTADDVRADYLQRQGTT